MGEPELSIFEPGNGIPNSRLPLVLWRGRLPARTGDEAACALFERNGWGGTWVYTVYPFWHFHTKGHEVLACVAGAATIGLGGDQGITVEIGAGDVCIIPAGVGHKRIVSSGDFLMAGGYPPGQSGDIVRPGEMTIEDANVRIARLALPASDPIDGDAIVAIWAAAQAESAFGRSAYPALHSRSNVGESVKPTGRDETGGGRRTPSCR